VRLWLKLENKLTDKIITIERNLIKSDVSIEPLEPQQIKQLRESFNVSQSVFAAILNISSSTVQKWEIGQKRPTGAAVKLLHLVREKGLESLIY